MSHTIIIVSVKVKEEGLTLVQEAQNMPEKVLATRLSLLEQIHI